MSKKFIDELAGNFLLKRRESISKARNFSVKNSRETTPMKERQDYLSFYNQQEVNRSISSVKNQKESSILRSSGKKKTTKIRYRGNALFHSGNKEIDRMAVEMQEKNTEVQRLTRFVAELRKKDLEGDVNLPLILENERYLPVSEREKFERILTENRKLKSQNQELITKNKWLTERLAEQSKMFSARLNRKIVGLRPSESISKENKSEATEQILQWYYTVSNKFEKMVGSFLRNISTVSFMKSIKSILK